MGQLSISLEVRDVPCLVVGGGDVAARKIHSLAEAGACVTVVAPDVDARIAERGDITVHRRPFASSDIAEHRLVFACTDSRTVNEAVAAAASAAGAWVNVADDPEACTFFVNSALQRGLLTIGIGTGGASPALARRIRERLEAEFGEAYGPFVALLGKLRREVLATEDDPAKRRAIFDSMAAVPCDRVMAEGGVEALERELRALMSPAGVRK